MSATHILLDENIPRRLKRLFAPGYVVQTVQDCGFDGKKNGELLRLAEKDFDVFVTMDKGIRFQQATTKFDIAIIVLRAHTNRYADLAPLMPRVSEALRALEPNEVRLIGEV